MAGRTVVKGIVLRSVDTRESDKILTVLTDTLGKIPVVAKGARSRRSRTAAAAQLLASSEMTLSERHGWQIVAAAGTIALFDRVRRDVDEDLLLADREFMQTNIDNAVKSPAFGFSFDATNVRTQVSSVNNVITQYFNALTNGELDPSTTIDEFNSALESAGLNDIIAEKQAQLDEWLASRASN